MTATGDFQLFQAKFVPRHIATSVFKAVTVHSVLLTLKIFLNSMVSLPLAESSAFESSAFEGSYDQTEPSE